MRLSTLIGLLLILLLPLDAAAFWLAAEGQCFDDASPMWGAVDHSPQPDIAVSDCVEAFDPTDPSYNACFELAEHPISTLPELIAENQARHLAAALVGVSAAVAAPVAEAPLPSPSEASVEDPALPGRPLVLRPASPRPSPNACSVYPDDCERAPVIPTLNLEGSVPVASNASPEFEYPPQVEAPTHRGPPSLGVGPATGVRTRLDRPPELG